MKKLRILIAEAESQIRMELNSIVSSLGHEALPAADGREALSIFSDQAPDLAVIDIRMPFADGFETARTMCRLRTIPILLLTASSEQIPVPNAASLLIQGYLVKPVEKPVLAAEIESAMARFMESQALEREAAELRYDLESVKIVNRAKAILIQRGKSEEEAYREIQKQARSRRVSLRLAANELLRTPAENSPSNPP